ncbi:MAG: Aldose 1-epimerase precursor [Verrucomicrobiota bacterium]
MKPFNPGPGDPPALLFTLENDNGFRADITNYGGAVVRLFAPDRAGQFGDVALGFDSIAGYLSHPDFFGTLVGRYANRIARGEFVLNGTQYRLATNNHPGGMACHLHGGRKGFDKVLWAAEELDGAEGPALRLRHVSVDGDEGYPGNLEVTVTYTVTRDQALRIDYTATTDRATPLNLTNHSYFNLAGAGHNDVLDHVLTLNASSYTPVDPGLIPLGKIAPVAGTPLDFRTPRVIGDRIAVDDEQLRRAGGYDHNFVIDGAAGTLRPAATVTHPRSGRTMDVLTTEPGVQFYTGNFLDGSYVAKDGQRYRRRGGFCLETQHFPDSPNQPEFPSTILRPGQTFRSTTVYRFRAQ